MKPAKPQYPNLCGPIRTARVKEPVRCPRCGAHWVPRVANPVRCPRCSRVLVKGRQETRA
jgi:DNA-directed RNA polymerase subunit RPC12/RpoP